MVENKLEIMIMRSATLKSLSLVLNNQLRLMVNLIVCFNLGQSVYHLNIVKGDF